MGGQHMPGEEAWLIGERRSSGERKYYLSNLPVDTNFLKVLASTIKARWICEQAHQQLKEELGLDHFEGRSWHGIHRHALMTMIAYAFLQHRRLASARREKESTSHHHSQACQRYVMPSSLTSCAGRISDVRTVGYGSARHSAEMHSAKVVLEWPPPGSSRQHRGRIADRAHDGLDNASETAFSSPVIQFWNVVPAGSVSVTPTTGIFACWAIRTMRCAAASLA